MPVAQADTTTFANADYYVIAVVQHREQMSSSLPATLLREYVQLSTHDVPGKHVALMNDLIERKLGSGPDAGRLARPSASTTRITSGRSSRPRRTSPCGSSSTTCCRRARTAICSCRPTRAHGLGHGADEHAATRSTRARYRTRSATQPAPLYPKADQLLQGQPGDAAPARRQHPVDQRRDAAPVDHAGRREHAVAAGCQRQGRPRHGRRAKPANVPDCSAADDGCQTFYYTNQQSARLMFYHDHSWGITRLNVYAGEAAGYLIGDPTEKKLGRQRDDSVRPDPAGHPGPDVRAGRGSARASRTRPGTRAGGAARAASGTTTCTCRRRTPATRAA